MFGPVTFCLKLSNYTFETKQVQTNFLLCIGIVWLIFLSNFGHWYSPHLTSPHLTSPHLTSPHLTLIIKSGLSECLSDKIKILFLVE
jgi:hypothetical protein